jgi:hypothetical protein
MRTWGSTPDLVQAFATGESVTPGGASRQAANSLAYVEMKGT